MSTMADKHGHAHSDTEVPRESLVKELKTKTDFFTTQDLKVKELSNETTIEFSPGR
jgi:hypothetical protein